MPHAERSQIVSEIDRWVIRHTFDLLSESGTFEKRPKSIFALNLSGQSICEDGFLDFVITELNRTGVPPTSICFEVTETAAILNMVRAKQFMLTLRKYGCLFSLDDFGAGLSSFSYLKTLPINYLKIDGQFVRDIADDPVCEAMIAAINQMGHAMGVKTIAESVENSAIKKRLAQVGIDYVQGDSIAKPRPLSTELKAIKTGRRTAARRRDARRRSK